MAILAINNLERIKAMKNLKLLSLISLLFTNSLFAQVGVITFECNNEIITVQLSEILNNPNATVDLNGDGFINESDYIIFLVQQYDCEEDEDEEEWGDDIDAFIEQLEIDCASQNDLGESCGILEMIYSCMNGSEDTCLYLEEIYEDFYFEEG